MRTTSVTHIPTPICQRSLSCIAGRPRQPRYQISQNLAGWSPISIYVCKSHQSIRFSMRFSTRRAVSGYRVCSSGSKHVPFDGEVNTGVREPRRDLLFASTPEPGYGLRQGSVGRRCPYPRRDTGPARWLLHGSSPNPLEAAPGATSRLRPWLSRCGPVPNSGDMS